MIWVLKDERMLVLIGLIAGIAATTSIWVVAERREQPPEQVDVEAVVTQVMSLHAPSENLTEPDLLKVPCSSEFIEQNTDLLCREMFCRMQQRGIDAQTSQSDCNEIANISNTKSIQAACDGLEGDTLEKCTDLFFKRK